MNILMLQMHLTVFVMKNVSMSNTAVNEKIGRREPELLHKVYFINLRKVDNSNKWKNYVIVTRVKLSVKLDALVVQSIFI